MTFTPNFIGAMGSLIILAMAFFMGTNGLAFAALSMLILAAVFVVWVAFHLGMYCLSYRIATQLEAAARFAKGASND